MSALQKVTDATFPTEVDAAEGLVLVDFAAAWCGPCRIVHPILEKLSEGYGARLKVVTLDVDENPVTATRFGIRNLPTMLFLREGAVVDQLIGALPKQLIQAKIELHLGAAAAA